MPTAIVADWTALRAMYVRGLPAKQISEQTGVPFAALRQRIRRERWDADVTAAQQAMSRAVTCDLQEAATGWVAEIDSFVRDTIRSIKSRDKDSLGLRDLKVLIEAAEVADRMARRTFGLDNEQPRPAMPIVQVNVGAAAPYAAHYAGAVIDVEQQAAAVG